MSFKDWKNKEKEQYEWEQAMKRERERVNGVAPTVNLKSSTISEIMKAIDNLNSRIQNLELNNYFIEEKFNELSSINNNQIISEFVNRLRKIEAENTYLKNRLIQMEYYKELNDFVAFSPLDMLSKMQEKLHQVLLDKPMYLKKTALSMIERISYKTPALVLNMKTLIIAIKILEEVDDLIEVERLIIEQCCIGKNGI
jgi:hypothetical protein